MPIHLRANIETVTISSNQCLHVGVLAKIVKVESKVIFIYFKNYFLDVVSCSSIFSSFLQILFYLIFIRIPGCLAQTNAMPTLTPTTHFLHTYNLPCPFHQYLTEKQVLSKTCCADLSRDT